MINYYRPDLVDIMNLPSSNNNIPEKIKKIIDKEKMDMIDELLISGLVPQHTNKISRNGIWGRNNISEYRKIPVKEAMEAYIKFYVELINRWERL